jgi:hypothetical protein
MTCRSWQGFEVLHVVYFDADLHFRIRVNRAEYIEQSHLDIYMVIKTSRHGKPTRNTALILHLSPHGKKCMVEKQMEPFPCFNR